jgi:hypothetical protein
MKKIHICILAYLFFTAHVLSPLTFTHPKKLKALTILATFEHSFINSEGKLSTGVLILNHNKTFSYKEIAGRGITSYIGKYEINKNTIILTNDNGAIRKFKYNLSYQGLILEYLEVAKRDLILFNIQPDNKTMRGVYKRSAPSPLDFKNSKKISAAYILKKESFLAAIEFSSDFSFKYRVLLNGKMHNLLKGRYTFKDGVLILENSDTRRYCFVAKLDNKLLNLSLKNGNFLFPFKQGTSLLFNKL